MLERHSKILEIISKNDISTQEELITRLRGVGYDVTQATVSRDIKKLRIIKAVNEKGISRYIANAADDTETSAYNLFASSVVSVRLAQNLVVIKTLPGMAQAVAAVVDSIHLIQSLGSIAGDDTLMVIAENVQDAEFINKKLQSMR